MIFSRRSITNQAIMNRISLVLALGVFVLSSVQCLWGDTKLSDDFILVNQFPTNKQGNVGLVIAKVTKNQTAVIAINIFSADGSNTTIAVYFQSAADWAKFSNAWNKGRNAPPPATESLNNPPLLNFMDVGQSMLQLSLSAKGTMSFVEIDKDKNIKLFDLSKNDFKAMDAAVNEMTAYFKN